MKLFNLPVFYSNIEQKLSSSACDFNIEKSFLSRDASYFASHTTNINL